MPGVPREPSSSRPLPNGWRWVRLGDVCDFLDFHRRPVSEPERARRIDGKAIGDLYPYYGANGQAGWIDGYLFDEPLILLAEDGGAFGSAEISIAYKVEGKVWVNNHAHVLRPREGVDLDFCLAAISIRPDVGRLATGNTRPKLNQAVAASILVPLPPLREQQRIAAVLRERMAAVEMARAAAVAQMESVKSLRAAYLRSVFGSPRSRTWPIVPLGELGVIQAGITLGRRLSGAATRSVPYLRVANVGDGRLDLGDVYQIEATDTEIEKCRLRYGDLLLTEGGDSDKLGRGTFWEDQLPECIHQNHIFRIRFDPSDILPQFISAQVGSPYGKTYFLARAKQTTGIATINQKVLSNFPVLVPPTTKQKEIAAELAEIMASVTRLRNVAQEELNTINALPAALLRRAFSGEI